MEYTGVKSNGLDKNNKRLGVTMKESSAPSNPEAENTNVQTSEISLKTLKNSINEKLCAISRASGKHVLPVKQQQKHHEDQENNTVAHESKQDIKNIQTVPTDNDNKRNDKLHLLRFILPDNRTYTREEKKDLEKKGNEDNGKHEFCKEDLCGKLLASAKASHDTFDKLIDEVTLKNNLNTICQMNQKGKHDKLQSLLMNDEQKICNQVSVVCMYFTKENSEVQRSCSEQPRSFNSNKCGGQNAYASSSCQVTRRSNVNADSWAEVHQESFDTDNSDRSESVISRASRKLQVVSRAMVCFPFNQRDDRSWCCIRSKRRKNRLRSRMPKLATCQGPCRSCTTYVNTKSGYPLYGQCIKVRTCGSNTGDSKGSGGTSPGQQDSGESHSGRMGSGGTSGGGAGGGAVGGGGGGQRGGGGNEERWWPPDRADVPDGDEKDGVPEKDLNNVDKGGQTSMKNELSLNISGDASLGSSSGGSSTKAVAGGRCTSGELSDEDNNSAMLLRHQQFPAVAALLGKSPPVTDGPDMPHPERKGSLDVHSRVKPIMVETALALFDPGQNFPTLVLQEMKPLRHSMFTEINKCLRHCFDRDYLATAFTCGMCLSLSAMVRHVGRCAHSRSKCKACDHVSNLLKMHVRRCLLLERQSTDNVPQGTDSGTILTGFISSLLTSVPLACPVDFCEKLRKKLKSSRSGNHQAHLEMVWGKEDLWQRMKKMIAYMYEIEVDYEMEMPAEDMLDSLSLSLPVPSVTPSRMLKKTLIENFKKGLKTAQKKKPEPPAKPKKIPPKIPPKPKIVPKKSPQERPEVKEKPVLPEVEMRAKTCPRRLLGAVRESVRDSDIPDDLYGPGAAAISEFSPPGAGAAASAPEVPSAPPLPQEMFVMRSQTLPGQQAMFHVQAQGPALPQEMVFQAEMMGAEFQEETGAMDMGFQQAPGEGQVEYGSVDDLHLFVNRVHEMKERYESGMSVKTVHEGIILKHMEHCLSVVEGRYAEGEGLEWVSIVHLGSGVTGRCWLIMDGQTHFQACVKRVDLLKFDKREVEVWSSLYHNQVADLYGVIVHENEVLMFAEFIDGGTLAEVIAKYAEDRALYGDTDEVVKGIDVQNSLFLYQQLMTVLNYFMQPDVLVLHEDIKADNVMIRAETSELVLVDFGLARHLHDSKKVPGGESPSGAQTHWSPEKAASEGHSFPADWWAATCVLLECITTKPPWVARYNHLKMLHFVIKMYAPPMADLPMNLDMVVRNLIQDAWTIDPNARPAPLQQAKHPAFEKYGVPYMVEDDPDSGAIQKVVDTGCTSEPVISYMVAENMSSSGSSTITPQQSLQSDPTVGQTPNPLLRKKKSDMANTELQKNMSSGSVPSGTTPDVAAGPDSVGQSSEGGVTPRLSVLLRPPSESSSDNYNNTGARPKTYDQPVTSNPTPVAPAVLQSKSVEEEQQQLVGELMQQNMTYSANPNFELQEILENMSTSSKGEDDAASNQSDDLSLHGDPLSPNLVPVVGTLIDFRKTNSDHLCSVRVKNLKQRWKDIIKTASTKIHTKFKDFTVFEDNLLTKPLRPDLAIGPGLTHRNVFVIEDHESWHWKCVGCEIVYNQDIIPNGGIYEGM